MLSNFESIKYQEPSNVFSDLQYAKEILFLYANGAFYTAEPAIRALVKLKPEFQSIAESEWIANRETDDAELN